MRVFILILAITFPSLTFASTAEFFDQCLGAIRATKVTKHQIQFNSASHRGSAIEGLHATIDSDNGATVINLSKSPNEKGQYYVLVAPGQVFKLKAENMAAIENFEFKEVRAIIPGFRSHNNVGGKRTILQLPDERQVLVSVFRQAYPAELPNGYRELSLTISAPNDTATSSPEVKIGEAERMGMSPEIAETLYQYVSGLAEQVVEEKGGTDEQLSTIRKSCSEFESYLVSNEYIPRSYRGSLAGRMNAKAPGLRDAVGATIKSVFNGLMN